MGETKREVQSEEAEASAFSVVANEPPLRWQRAVRLAPAGGLGARRRAIFFAVATWAPIALWALATGRFFDASTGEPLMRHYGVHVRCLVAIPLLILAETSLHKASVYFLPQLLHSGLVDQRLRPRFDEVLNSVRRLREASLFWVFVVGIAIAWSVADDPGVHADAMSWALDGGEHLGFGGLWFAYFVRPVFIALVLGWLWRILMLTVLFARIGGLGLSFVPTHPDGAGGVGFLEKFPFALAPVTLALSATLSSRWAHEIVYHGQTLAALRWSAAVFIVVWTLVLLMPMLALMPALLAAKRRALPGYAALVAEQGRLVRRQWVDGESVPESPVIEPAGVGPIADAGAMYEAVRSMRPLPIGKATLAGIIVPIIVPMLVVTALQVPLKDLLLKIAGALF